MNELVRPIARASLVPDPDARKDAPDEDEVEEAHPEIAEDTARFRKNVVDPSAER